MKTRKLGIDGAEVSAIGLGGMSFTGFFGSTNKAESFKCLDAARDHGITFLDTAEMYGKGSSEELIGEYQQSRGHRFSIATKGGIVVGGKRGENDNSEAALRRALEGSLKRLRIEHVELYYIHRRDWSIEIEDVAETLAKFQNEGKIGGFGFSEIAPSSLRRAHAVHPVTAVQNEYSLWTRYPELGMLQTCCELGVAFVPFSPLARGMLSDTFPVPANFAETDFRKNMPRFLAPNFSANCKLISAFRDFARSRGWSTTGAALAWILDQGEHLIPIPGTRSAAHLKEWVGAAEIKLTDEDRAEIERILPVGFAHGDRYSDEQIVGVERYC
ncbi:MAG: aldo/keto reductase [SAR324 cluster bacterium]|jgi:aryl-alcohol dehydrogenase-like predicted oxidoreductase|nr:aldo/keto reductase [SAR324 cluster bacterium]